MATLSVVRDRLAVTLARVEGKDGRPMHVVKRAGESPPSVQPAIVLGEPTADFEEGNARLGLDRWEIPLLVLVPGADYQLGAELLDEYLERRGAKSIRQVIDENSGLGLQDGTNARVTGVSEYGPREPGMVGAVLRLVVRTGG